MLRKLLEGRPDDEQNDITNTIRDQLHATSKMIMTLLKTERETGFRIVAELAEEMADEENCIEYAIHLQPGLSDLSLAKGQGNLPQQQRIPSLIRTEGLGLVTRQSKAQLVRLGRHHKSSGAIPSVLGTDLRELEIVNPNEVVYQEAGPKGSPNQENQTADTNKKSTPAIQRDIDAYIMAFQEHLDALTDTQINRIFDDGTDYLYMTTDPAYIKAVKVLFPSASNHRYYNVQTTATRLFYMDDNTFHSLAGRVAGAIKNSGPDAGVGANETELLQEAKKKLRGHAVVKNTFTYVGDGLCGTPDAISGSHHRPSCVLEFKAHQRMIKSTATMDLRQLFIYMRATRAQKAMYCYSTPKTSAKAILYEELPKTEWVSVNNMRNNHTQFLKAACARGLVLPNHVSKRLK